MTKRVTIRRDKLQQVVPSVPADDGSMAGTMISGKRVLLADLAKWISNSMQGRAENLDAFLNEQGIQRMTRVDPWASLPPLQVRTTDRRAEVEMDYDMRNRCYTFTIIVPPVFGGRDIVSQERITTDELENFMSRDSGEYILDRVSSALGNGVASEIAGAIRQQLAEVLRRSVHVRNARLRGRDT